MSSSPRAQRPLMRSYYLPAPAPPPYRAIGKTVLALVVVGAGALWGLSPYRDAGLGVAASPAPAPALPAATGEPASAAPLAAPAPAAVNLSAPRPVETVSFAPSLLSSAPTEAATAEPLAATAPITESAAVPATAPAADPVALAEPAPAAAEPDVAPPPAAPAAPALRLRWVVDGGPTVNLRAEASTSGAVLATLPLGTAVQELPTDEQTARPGWRRVVWNNREGWVSASLLRLDTVRIERVPVADQGIDADRPLRPGVYPLRELSTGRQIVDSSGPIYVDDGGARVAR